MTAVTQGADKKGAAEHACCTLARPGPRDYIFISTTFIYGGAHVRHSGGQRTICRLSSLLRHVGIKLRSSGSAASVFTHWATFQPGLFLKGNISVDLITERWK